MANDKPRDLADRTVVITGASSGFGKGTAMALAERGANVVLAARREQLLDELADQCRRQGVEAIAVPTDVSDADAVRDLADAALERFGAFDTWINDAGVGALGPFTDIPVAHHAQVIATNLQGTIYGCHAALSWFRRAGAGTLINIASGLGKIPAPYYATYTASKFGVVGLSDALRQELKLEDLHERIRVATVMPMAMDTAFFDHAANFTGKEPQPAGPLYDPQLVIDKLVELTANPANDEVIVGTAGKMYNAMHHLFPGMVEAIMARRVEKDQYRDVRDAPPDGGAVLEPSDQGVGVRAGRLDR